MPRSLAACAPALVLGLLVTARSARAQEAEAETGAERPLHVGALAGVAFPRPLSVEAVVGLGRRGVVGVEYGVLPALTISGVRTTLWGVAGDARIFPFRGPFFVGVRAGVQRLDAAGRATFGSAPPIDASLAVTTWYVNPRIGVLWTLGPGVTIGLNAGAQVPVAVSESSSPASFPGAPPQAVATATGRVASVVTPVTRQVLPTFDLLQLGYVY
jgi:hypothetical protein